MLRPAGAERFSAASRLQRGFDSLIARAESSGPLRVVVGLASPFRPEGMLSSQAAVLDQRSSITAAREALIARLPRLDPLTVKRYETIPYVAMELDAGGLRELSLAPEVVSLEEDVMLFPALLESVPLIGAPAAWAAGFDGTGQTVAVIDTGVDKTHPFLTGKVVSEACYSTSNSSLASVCPGGVAESTADGSGVNCTAPGCDHGTHVAGAAAGKGTSFSGVAPGANIIAIQVFSRVKNCSSSVNCIGALTSDVLKGMERVLTLSKSFPIASVNMSLGGPGSGASCDETQGSYKAIIDNLRAAGVAAVVAAGNDGNPGGISSPACISTAVSVGSTGDGSANGSSTTKVDAVSSFSNSASFLSLLAPGEWINSSIPGAKYGTFRGTSQAAPHVAGAWAVLKQKTPGASVGQVLQALVTTGVTVNDTRNGIVKPRIKVDAAVTALPAAVCTYVLSPSVFSTPQGGGTGNFGVTAPSGCAWTATSNVPWLTITAGASGSGNGSVAFSAAPNTSIDRAGTILLGGQIFIVSQAGAPVLSVDDGSFENASGLALGGTSWRVNRLTPAAYPVTINAVAIYFPSSSGVTVGDSLTVLAAASPSGSSDIDGTQFQTVSATVKALDQFNVYPIPGVAVSSGDFVVGMKMTHSSGEFPFALDETASKGRSYRSTDGADFSTITGNYGIRAVVSLSLACPTVISLSPTSATAGTKAPVSIIGTGYSGVNGLKFSPSVSSTFTIESDTRLQTTLPDFSVTGPLTLSKTECAPAGTPVFTVLPCLQISPGSQIFASTGGTGKVDLAAVPEVPSCPWTVSSDSSWITITSGSSGSGGGSVSYSVATNYASLGRKGTLTIGGRAFAVYQAGYGGSCAPLAIVPGQFITASLDSADCTGVLKETNRTDRYTITAVAGQQITLVERSSAFDSYLGLFDSTGKLLLQDDNGGGGKDAQIQTTLAAAGTYLLEATCASPLTGSYTLEFSSVIPGCTFDISPKSATVSGGGGNSSVAISTQAGCGWAAGTDASWVTVGPPSTGSGSASVAFTAAANKTSKSRTAILGVAGQRFTVAQPPCWTINVPEKIVDSAGGQRTIDVQAESGCGNWNALSDVYWISINSSLTVSGSSTVRFTVSPNTGTTGRRGTLQIAGYTVPVYQAASGADCVSSSISPGQTVNGTLLLAECPGITRISSSTDRYLFGGRAGQKVDILLKSTAFDAYLGLIDPSGAVVKTDDSSGGGSDARIQYVLTATGTYVIEAASYSSGKSGAYALSLVFQRLLLQGEKVAVEVAWRNQYNSQTGAGGAIQRADKYGYLYFSDPNNPEVFVKVLDFGASSPYLLFWAGLTDFEYTVTFTNLVTGAKSSFLKAAGSTAGGADTTTLPHARAVLWERETGLVRAVPGERDNAGTHLEDGWLWASSKAAFGSMELGQLQPGPAAEGETLLANGQIAASVVWKSQYSGQTGQAIPIPQKDEFCFFYFSDRENPEVFVKALDWGAPTPFKIFAAGLTDFEYTVTFRNVKTGATVVFKKAASLYDGYAANMDR